jgi:hypothetical protein
MVVQRGMATEHYRSHQPVYHNFLYLLKKGNPSSTSTVELGGIEPGADDESSNIEYDITKEEEEERAQTLR